MNIKGPVLSPIFEALHFDLCKIHSGDPVTRKYFENRAEDEYI